MVGLVARREVVTRVRERSFLLSTLVILGILTAIVVLPQLLEGDGREEVRVAAAGADGRELVRAAQPAGAALGLDLRLRPVAARRRRGGSWPRTRRTSPSSAGAGGSSPGRVRPTGRSPPCSRPRVICAPVRPSRAGA
jgi:hypothetical protein